MYCPECELEVRNFKDERCPFCQAALLETPSGGISNDGTDPQRLELKELICDVKKKLDEIDSLPDRAHSRAEAHSDAGSGQDSVMEEAQLPDMDEGESLLKKFRPDEPADTGKKSPAETSDTEPLVNPEDVERVLETLDGASTLTKPASAEGAPEDGRSAISDKPSEIRMLENLIEVAPEEAAGTGTGRQRSFLWPLLGTVIVLVLLTGRVGPRFFPELIRSISLSSRPSQTAPSIEKPLRLPEPGRMQQKHAAMNPPQEPLPARNGASKPEGAPPVSEKKAVKEMPAEPAQGESPPASKAALRAAPADSEDPIPAETRTSVLTLQVMSLTNHEFVAPVLKNLNAKGFPAYVVESKTRMGRPLYKIRVGQYETMKAAARAAAALKKQAQQDCLIVSAQDK